MTTVIDTAYEQVAEALSGYQRGREYDCPVCDGRGKLGKVTTAYPTCFSTSCAAHPGNDGWRAVHDALGIDRAALRDTARGSAVAHIPGQVSLEDAESPAAAGTAEDAEFTEVSLAKLTACAVSPDHARSRGVMPVRHPDHVPDSIHRFWVIGTGGSRGPGMLFNWVDGDRVVPQFRPDKPVAKEDGEEAKYIFPKDCGGVLWHLREGAPGAPVIFCEGALKALAVDQWAPPDYGVVAFPGAQSWYGTDLSWAEGRKVALLFDADVSSNQQVHDAAVEAKDAFDAEGAADVVFVTLPGAKGKDGIDDVLGRRAEDKRTSYLVNLVNRASQSPGKRPVKKASRYFDNRGSLQAETLALDICKDNPCAVSAEEKVAVYRDGVFEVNAIGLMAAVRDKLREQHRPAHLATAEQSLLGLLYTAGTVLPDRVTEPLLNCANGMLDLRTGELKAHGPEHLSKTQVPVAWDPDAECPTYLAWATERVGDQLDDLEESAAVMLDQSRTPTKGVFLFGPTRSGKGTYLRIMQAIAGGANTSSVTLHELADDKFAAADVYGRMLNVAGDLSARDVQDVSLFKTLTGEDLVRAQRKHGKAFKFVSTALFAFSANVLPNVSEASGAYVNRVRPFKFPHSFDGSEDPSIERKIMAELPGILVRWVKAWQRYTDRGGYQPVNAAVAKEFAEQSDRVVLWLNTYCRITPARDGDTLPDADVSTVTDLYNAFRVQQERDGASGMGKLLFKNKLLSVRGVAEVRTPKPARKRGVNAVVLPFGATNEPEDDGVGNFGGNGVGNSAHPSGNSAHPQMGAEPDVKGAEDPGVGKVGNFLTTSPSTQSSAPSEGVKSAHEQKWSEVAHPAHPALCIDCGGPMDPALSGDVHPGCNPLA